LCVDERYRVDGDAVLANEGDGASQLTSARRSAKLQAIADLRIVAHTKRRDNSATAYDFLASLPFYENGNHLIREKFTDRVR
jgi:hypothetical protein